MPTGPAPMMVRSNFSSALGSVFVMVVYSYQSSRARSPFFFAGAPQRGRCDVFLGWAGESARIDCGGVEPKPQGMRLLADGRCATRIAPRANLEQNGFALGCGKKRANGWKHGRFLHRLVAAKECLE